MRYELRAYDKDNDVYDLIIGSDYYHRVYLVAFVMHPMLSEDRLLSKDNKKPYDRLEIWDTEVGTHEKFGY